MTGKLIGYARTSTVEQEAGFEAQIRDLEAAGVTKLYREQVSSQGARPQLEEALRYIRKGDGDVLVVTKLDRLARSVADLSQIVARLQAEGASLRVLAMNLDTETPTGKLLVNLLGSIAQFEREMMLERQREGIAKAKGEGKYKGRKPTAKAKAAEVKALDAEKVPVAEIAKRLGIGRSSVYRILGRA